MHLSCLRFELDAKSGPLEACDFGKNGNCGEIGDFRKNRQRAGDIQNVTLYSNWMPKMAPSKYVDNQKSPYNCEATALRKVQITCLIGGPNNCEAAFIKDY